MKFFLDTADIRAIRRLRRLGVVDVVTTNLTLLAKSGRWDCMDSELTRFLKDWNGLKEARIGDQARRAPAAAAARS